MWREFIFCIIIIISIITFDYFMKNYIKDSTEEITGELSNIKEQILNVGEEDKINEIKVEELRNTWQKRYKKLGSVVEHDELEKVETNLTALYSALESEEQSEAISKLDESVYILRHIKDKYSLKIENVF